MRTDLIQQFFSRLISIHLAGTAPLAILLCLGVILRWWNLGERPLWLDEARLYWIVQGDFASIIVNNYLNNSAPPLFAFLLALVTRINESESALRIISFFASVAVIPAIYVLARRFVTYPAALFCAFLVTIAPTQIQYAQQVREYALTFLLAVLTLLLFDRYLETNTWRHLLLLMLIYWIDVWTQYGLSLLIGGLALVLLTEITYRRNAVLIPSGLLYASTLVMQIAVFFVSLRYQIRPGGFGASDYLAEGYWVDGSLVSLVKLAIVNSQDLLHFALFVPSLTLLLSSTGILTALRQPRGRRAFLFFVVPLLLTWVFAVFRLYPYGGMRQDIFLTPMIYLFASWGFDYVVSFDRQRILAILLLVLCIIHPFVQTIRYHTTPPLEDIRPIVERLRSDYHTGDTIYVYYGAEPAFRYYYRDHSEKWIIGIESRGDPKAYFCQLDSIVGAKNLWLVFSHCYNRECEQIVEYMTRRYRVIERVIGDDVALYYVVLENE